MTDQRQYSHAMAFEDRIRAASDKYAADGYTVDKATIQKQRPDRLDPISPSAWAGDPPPLDWIVDGCFLNRTVGAIAGDGGLGKSLLMQQLCTAAALGRPWLGLETKQCKSLALFCEDDDNELWRRQAAINRHYGCSPEDLRGKVLYAPRPGLDNAMVEFQFRARAPAIQPLFEETRAQALSFGAQIIILDTRADICSGNEIDRDQPTRFVTMLRKLAIEINGVIIFTEHPSLTGMSTGSGRSGSTAWSNKVRSRVYLTSNAGQDEPSNERVLKTMKNNHGPTGGKLRIIWDKGVFVPGDEFDGPMDSVEKMDLDGRLTEALRQAVMGGSNPAADPHVANGFVPMCRRLLGFANCKHTDLVNAQIRLLRSGRWVKVEIGPPSKRRAYLRTTDTRLSGEPEEGAK